MGEEEEEEEEEEEGGADLFGNFSLKSSPGGQSFCLRRRGSPDLVSRSR